MASTMKSFSNHFFSAVGAGALAAFFLHSHPGALTASVRTAFHPAVRPAEGQHPGNSVASAPVASHSPARAIASIPTPGLAANAPSHGRQTLLLNEPVEILSPSHATWTYLPRGTSVHLVASNSATLLVSNGSETVTVPRSTVVAGVARSN